jgi:hypothetical protein
VGWRLGFVVIVPGRIVIGEAAEGRAADSGAVAGVVIVLEVSGSGCDTGWDIGSGGLMRIRGQAQVVAGGFRVRVRRRMDIGVDFAGLLELVVQLGLGFGMLIELPD